jgi:hypothetical protein
LPEHGNAAFPGGLYAGKDAGDPNGITYNLPEHGNAAFPGGLYAGNAGDPMPAIPTALHTICRTGTPPSQAARMPADAGDPMPAITYN